MKEDPFKDERLVRYLLGELTEEEQSEIEERAFEDRRYLQEILAAESDLIDEYVRGELTDSRRRLFDRRFLASSERRKKVEFAQALAHVLPETTIVREVSRPLTARPQVGLWAALVAFLRGLNPAARLSFAAAALFLLIGSLWAVTETLRLRGQIAQLQAEQQSRQQDRQVLEGQLADERTRSEELSSSLQHEREQRERNEELIRELERQREAAATKPILSTVFSLALLPGTARSGSEGSKLVLPQSARLVRLQLGIEPGDEYPSFRVELRGQTAQPVWSQDNVAVRNGRGGRTVVVTLPANRLRSGQYELALKGVADGKTEDIAFYYFEVLKK